MRRLTLALAGMAAALALPAAAQAPAPAAQPHIRGAVKSLTGLTLAVAPHAGKTVMVNLSPKWTVVVMKPVDVSAIKPGSFIGTTEVEKADGTGRSLEVHVFPPGVKMGEGHYPWDLKPHSMMTNGTVGKVVASPQGRTLDVSYPGGARHILVPPNVPIVQITPGTRELVKPGVQVFIVPAPPPANGVIAADTVALGENGAAPPM
jgi:hypothetical protein